MIDLTRLSPAPWRSVKAFERADLFFVANKLTPVGSFPTETDCDFSALARNAFEVMMRRKWTVKFMPGSGETQRWYVDFRSPGFDTILSREKTGYVHYHSDPFSALIAAAEWYRQNVEGGTA